MNILRRLALFLIALSTGYADPVGHRIAWTNNVLTLTAPDVPGSPIEIWYLEAFLRPGAHGRDWRQSVLPHRTSLTAASPDGSRLEFLTTIGPATEVRHTVECVPDGLDLRFTLVNRGTNRLDLQWFQPACIRVGGFTGLTQSNFIERAFLFTTNGLTPLDRTGRTLDALYRGGQVYPMEGVAEADANPRPIASVRPVNGLIGCYSRDNRWILATASSRTHELFEGVYACIHSDPAVGGLDPGQTKTVRQKIYLLPNEPEALLRRYERDFPDQR